MKEFTVVISPGVFEKVIAMNVADVLRCYSKIDSIFCNGIRCY